jgi:hypothetical protein
MRPGVPIVLRGVATVFNPLDAGTNGRSIQCQSVGGKVDYVKYFFCRMTSPPRRTTTGDGSGTRINKLPVVVDDPNP